MEGKTKRSSPRKNPRVLASIFKCSNFNTSPCLSQSGLLIERYPSPWLASRPGDMDRSTSNPSQMFFSYMPTTGQDQTLTDKFLSNSKRLPDKIEPKCQHWQLIEEEKSPWDSKESCYMVSFWYIACSPEELNSVCRSCFPL